MKKKTIVAIGLSVASIFIGAQAQAAPNKPYPQYLHKDGIPEPAFIDDPLCLNAYKYGKWVKDYIKEHDDIPGALYVEGHITGGLPGDWPSYVDAVSASEHTGYGMILSPLMAGYDDYKNGECLLGLGPVPYTPKEVFDGLFKLYKALRSQEGGDHLMSWIVPSQYKDNNGDLLSTSSSATDGDFDIAYGLILAHQQWGDSQYKDAAEDIIADILEYDISNQGLILAGNWAEPNSNVTRSSDWSFGHLSAFAEYSSSNRWDEIRERNQDAMLSVAHSTTGLVPDFLEYDGNSGRPLGPAYLCEHFPTQHFSENASRTPWRLAVDFLHTGDTTSRNQLRKIADWIKGEVYRPSSPVDDFYDWRDVKDTYKLNGDSFSWNSLPSSDPETGESCSYTSENEAEGLSKGKNKNRLNFMGPMITSLLADGDGNQNEAALAWGLNLLGHAVESSGDQYFGDSIRLMSLLTATQTWWNPASRYNGTGAYNANTGQTFSSLQTAIDAADNSGNLIQVSKNANLSNINITKDNITIEGLYSGVNRPHFNSGSGNAITIWGWC